MSFSFAVPVVPETPPFAKVLESAELSAAPKLAAAGDVIGGWPKGLLQKLPDASSAPSSLQIGPQLEEIFRKMGVAGTFLIHLPGRSTRGVEVGRSAKAIQFRVTALASADDYDLAVRLAASLARLTAQKVQAEHGPDGHAIAPLDADALLKTFDRAFFEKNAAEMAAGLLDGIARGGSLSFYGPQGWITISAADLSGTSGPGRVEAARKKFLAATPASTSVSDADRAAVLLTRAMMFAAAADSNLSPEETTVIQSLLLTTPELRGYDASKLIELAKAENFDLAPLKSLSAPLRRKAFVLAAEVLASTRGGKIAGDLNDPNVKAAAALAGILGLVAEQSFLVDVAVAVGAKYLPDEVPDDYARAFALAMLIPAAADGKLSDEEKAVLVALSRTVPQLASRDLDKLLEEARLRLAAGGLDAASADLKALTRLKNKCFGLACEMTWAAGVPGPEAALALPMIQNWLQPTGDFAARALATWSAKYGGVGKSSPAATTTDTSLDGFALRAIAEGTKLVLAGNYYFAVLVTEDKGAVQSRISKATYLPQSTDEARGALAQMGSVDRYALVYPGLSFSLGGSVVVAEAGDRSGPRGVRVEQRYEPQTPEAPSRLAGEPRPGGTCESLLFDPPAAGALRFEIVESRPRTQFLPQAPWSEGTGDWTVHVCRAGNAPFALALRETRTIPGMPGAQLADARLLLGPDDAATTFAQALDRNAGAKRGGEVPASAVILSSRALREANGFASPGGTWIAAKWTFESGGDSTEVYVNLQPAMRRGELRPREDGLAALARLLVPATSH